MSGNEDHRDLGVMQARSDEVLANEHLATRLYEFTRWSGRTQRVLVERVEFEPGGVATFWTGDRLQLAVKREDWNDLHEVVE